MKKNITVDKIKNYNGKTLVITDKDSGRIVTVSSASKPQGKGQINNISIRRQFIDGKITHNFLHRMEFGENDDMQIYTEYNNGADISFVTQLTAYFNAKENKLSDINYHEFRKKGERKSNFSGNYLSSRTDDKKIMIDIPAMLEGEIRYLRDLMKDVGA